MPRYTKENPRITIKFINADTEETLFEINDRNWMNVGEIFSSSLMSSIAINELKNRKLPKNIMVLAVSEYHLEN